MKCPYRKIVIHQPDRMYGDTRKFAVDTEEYPNCYENKCPFYIGGRCMRAEAEMEGGNKNE